MSVFFLRDFAVAVSLFVPMLHLRKKYHKQQHMCLSVISWWQYLYLHLRSIYVRSIINNNICANGETYNSVVLCMIVHDLLLSVLPLIVYCS